MPKPILKKVRNARSAASKKFADEIRKFFKKCAAHRNRSLSRLMRKLYCVEARHRQFILIKYTKDGRTILTGPDYTELRFQKAKEAEYLCEWCAEETGLSVGQLHHENGRGGGRRDDTLEGTIWLCIECHEREHRPETIH